MILRAFGLFPVSALLTLGACQTAPTPYSGLLSSYEGVAPQEGSLRAVVNQRRDDQAASEIERVFLQPSAFAPAVGSEFSEGERRAVLHEVDRQICFEASRRFTLVPAPEPDAAIIRTWVVRLDPTGRVGSGVSAAANFFNPIPGVNVRAPFSTGGIAIESEMLAPNDAGQIAALTWGRNATVVGTDSPSFSRIGDALQFAGAIGDTVAETFAPEDRKKRDVPDPDPCAHYGARRNITGTVVGIASGLYIPEVGQSKPAD